MVEDAQEPSPGNDFPAFGFCGSCRGKFNLGVVGGRYILRPPPTDAHPPAYDPQCLRVARIRPVVSARLWGLCGRWSARQSAGGANEFSGVDPRLGANQMRLPLEVRGRPAYQYVEHGGNRWFRPSNAM
jgi:hypothetical protein